MKLKKQLELLDWEKIKLIGSSIQGNGSQALGAKIDDLLGEEQEAHTIEFVNERVMQLLSLLVDIPESQYVSYSIEVMKIKDKTFRESLVDMLGQFGKEDL